MASRLRDRRIKYISSDGNLSLTLVRLTDSINLGIEKHGFNPLAQLIFAQALVAVQLLAHSLKPDDTISLKIHTDTKIKGIVAETNGRGETRGYLVNGDIEPEGENQTQIIENALGKATLNVYKFMTHSKEPSQSIIEMEHANIAKDLTSYFLQSEQIATALRIDIMLDGEMKIIEATGTLAQALPGTSDSMISKLESDFSNLYPYSRYIFQEQKVDDYVSNHLSEYKFKKNNSQMLDFYCRCSKKNFAKHLMALGKSELESMAKEGSQEIICQYCNEKVYFTPDDLRLL